VRVARMDSRRTRQRGLSPVLGPDTGGPHCYKLARIRTFCPARHGAARRPSQISRTCWVAHRGMSARCCPRDLGLVFSTWSLSKLADYLAVAGIASVSREAIRQILHAGGVRWQATKTWKASTDPDFIAKMRRLLDLYDHPPADGRVVCANEFGPLNCSPAPAAPGAPPPTPQGCGAPATAPAECGT
jgi:hypothetical protein